MDKPLVVTDRTQLESLLGEDRTSLMIIVGEEDSKEERLYHDIRNNVREPWRQVAVVYDMNLLTPEEKSAWRVKDAGHYVVLSSTTDGARRPVDSGRVSTLLSRSGTPSLLRLRKVFSRAEK